MLMYFEGGPETASGPLEDWCNHRRLSVDEADLPQTFAVPYKPPFDGTDWMLTPPLDWVRSQPLRAQYVYRGRATRHDPETGTWVAIAVYRYLRDVESGPAERSNWKQEGF